MNKKFLFILVFILVMLGYIFKIDKIIVIEITNLIDNIKQSYKNTYNDYSISFSSHFDQAKKIQKLEKSLEENQKYKILYTITNQKNKEYEENIIKPKDTHTLKYVEILSYLNINDFSKVLLNTNMKIGNKILALSTIDGYSAGIVMQKNNQIIAYLNNNPKSNYAVFIGDNKIPGITAGINKDNNIKIKYIPKWHTINVGDVVYTSGMDNIFPAGLKVGVVEEVKDDINTQMAYIKPSIEILNQKYFYIIKNK